MLHCFPQCVMVTYKYTIHVCWHTSVSMVWHLITCASIRYWPSFLVVPAMFNCWSRGLVRLALDCVPSGLLARLPGMTCRLTCITLILLSVNLDSCWKALCSGLFRSCCRAHLCNSLLITVRSKMTVYYYYYFYSRYLFPRVVLKIDENDWKGTMLSPCSQGPAGCRVAEQYWNAAPAPKFGDTND